MKENYTVSFVKNDVNQCRLVKAESKEQALAYFAEIEPDAEICGAALDQCNLERRGCPVEIVPDGWTPAPAETETADKSAPQNRDEYIEDIAAAVLQYCSDNPETIAEADDLEELADLLNEKCWDNDGVTGNASGSYTFSRWEAENNIAHNLDTLVEACGEFGQDIGEAIRKGAEYCDVTIRCYLLGEAVALAIDRHGAEIMQEAGEVIA